MAKKNELTTLINQFIADCRKLKENGESFKKVAELFFEEKYQILMIIPDGTPAARKMDEAFKLWD